MTKPAYYFHGFINGLNISMLGVRGVGGVFISQKAGQ
jgi:hypothetical protein